MISRECFLDKAVYAIKEEGKKRFRVRWYGSGSREDIMEPISRLRRNFTIAY